MSSFITTHHLTNFEPLQVGAKHQAIAHDNAIIQVGPPLAAYTAKIQYGGGRHLRFWIFGHISVVNQDICFRFGTLIYIENTMVTVTENSTFIRSPEIVVGGLIF